MSNRTEAAPQTPDYCYDEGNWEATYQWADRSEATLDLYGKDIREIKTLICGPTKWVCNVPVSFDEDGFPDETEVRWFDTEEEAKAAANRTAP